MRVAQGFVCKMCRGGGRKAADECCFEDVKLECVGEFVYLGDIWNDTGGLEQAVGLGQHGQSLESLVKYCVREGLLGE